MMAKNPDERHASANEVADALGPWLPNAETAESVEVMAEPLLPSPAASMVVRLPVHDRRGFRLGWPVVAVLVMLGCGLGVIAGQFLRNAPSK